MKFRLLILLATFSLLPTMALAGGGTGFVPLVGIPGIQETGDFNGYINALYGLAISIAALIAVIKIVLAGAKYMMDDIVTHKSEAKEDIKNSLIGLLIIIGAVVILTTINSDLTNLSINADIASLDNSMPSLEEELTAFEQLCADATENGGSCAREICNTSDAFEDIKNLNGLTCEEVCTDIEGMMQTVRYTHSLCNYDTTKLAALNEEALQNYADENCPATSTSCRAEFSNTYCEGILDWNFSGCKSQCLDERNGVAFDDNSWACVFANGQDVTTSDLQIDQNATYTQMQNADEIAGDYPIRSLTIIGTEAINGMVRVRYNDTNEEVDLVCSYIQPNPCIN